MKTKYALVTFPKGGILAMSLVKNEGLHYLYDYFYNLHEERLLKLNKIKERINGCR